MIQDVGTSTTPLDGQSVEVLMHNDGSLADLLQVGWSRNLVYSLSPCWAELERVWST